VVDELTGHYSLSAERRLLAALSFSRVRRQGAIHGVIKGKSTPDVASAVRGGKSLKAVACVRSTLPRPGNCSETLSNNLPSQTWNAYQFLMILAQTLSQTSV